MIRSAFAIVLLALGFTAVPPAHADFAAIEFSSGYRRIWTDTAFGPEDGHYLWFLSPSWGWQYRFLTFEGADAMMHQAVVMHRLSLVVAADSLRLACAWPLSVDF